MFERTDDFIGGSLQGECLISPAKLVEAFGQPGEADGYKVSGEYVFIDPDNGDSFTLYDWKYTTLYDSEGVRPSDFWASTEPYRFHIGGRTGTCDVPKIAEAVAQIAAGEESDFFATDPREREVEVVTDGASYDRQQARLRMEAKAKESTKPDSWDRLAATRIVIKASRVSWDKRFGEARILSVSRDAFELFLRDLEEAAGLR